MNTLEKVGLWVGVVALVLIAVSLIIPGHVFGAGTLGPKLVENYDPYVRYNNGTLTALPIKTTGGLIVGTNGTTINSHVSGFCNIQASSQTIAASSTQTVDCQASTTGTQSALSGVVTGQRCFLSQATTTPSIFQGLDSIGVSASSTNGFITTNVFNGTGASFSWTKTASSSWSYLCES